MNYIYDIFLNFHKEDFDFYDWNVNDNIIHVRKMPLIKVNSNLLYQVINYNFISSLDWLKKISNRTEIFSNKSIKILKYMCIFSDGKDAVAIKFSSNGKKEKMSRFLIDEKEEILEVADNIGETSLEINIDNKQNHNNFRTRLEQEIYCYIEKEFNKKNYDKLKYTYFECFNKEEPDYNKIINKLKTALNNNWEKYYEKIYNILKLSSMKKSKNLLS